jgi:hypothetical protein
MGWRHGENHIFIYRHENRTTGGQLTGTIDQILEEKESAVTVFKEAFFVTEADGRYTLRRLNIDGTASTVGKARYATRQLAERAAKKQRCPFDVTYELFWQDVPDNPGFVTRRTIRQHGYVDSQVDVALDSRTTILAIAEAARHWNIKTSQIEVIEEHGQ